MRKGVFPMRNSLLCSNLPNPIRTQWYQREIRNSFFAQHFSLQLTDTVRRVQLALRRNYAHRVEEPVPNGLLVVPGLKPGLEVDEEGLVVGQDLRDLEEDVLDQDVADNLVRLVLVALQRLVVSLPREKRKSGTYRLFGDDSRDAQGGDKGRRTREEDGITFVIKWHSREGEARTGKRTYRNEKLKRLHVRLLHVEELLYNESPRILENIVKIRNIARTACVP